MYLVSGHGVESHFESIIFNVLSTVLHYTSKFRLALCGEGQLTKYWQQIMILKKALLLAFALGFALKTKIQICLPQQLALKVIRLMHACKYAVKFCVQTLYRPHLMGNVQRGLYACILIKRSVENNFNYHVLFCIWVLTFFFFSILCYFFYYADL